MMREFSNKYLELLNTTLKGINLTRILDPDDFYNKQIIDSISAYQQDVNFKNFLDKTKLMVDVGFGGGFPILPMAYLLPDYQFIGFETRRKKADAVRLLARELGLNNVKLFHHKIEEVFLDKSCLVTLKAVGTVENFLPLVNTSESIMVSFYKGPGFYEQESPGIKKVAEDWNLIDPVTIDVPGTEKRMMVSFTNKNVPRGTSKTLVKLTDIL